MKFLDKRTNEIKTAHSIEIKEKKVHIKFSEKGKEYTYNLDNIEIINNNQTTDSPYKIYQFKKRCFKCKKNTLVYTYIKFDDGTDEDVVYPWDKERLLSNQHIFQHIQDPSIEYYGLKVIGDDERLDKFLLEKFPERIQTKYSKTLNRSYPMNLCEHCGSIQGWNFIYRQVNEIIKNMQKIDLYEAPKNQRL